MKEFAAMASRWKWELKAILKPNYWFRNYGTSKDLSDFIHESLDAGSRVEILPSYEMTIGGLTLWRGNYPYAYGYIITPGTPKLLPSRSAVLRLRDAECLADPLLNPSLAIRRAIAKARGEA